MIAASIRREQMLNGRIELYTVEAVNVSSLAAWGNVIVSALESWPDEMPYIALHDLSNAGVSLPVLALTGYKILDPGPTRSSQFQIERILSRRPQLRIKLAVVLSSALSGQIAMKRGKTSSPDHPQIDARLYNDRDTAIEWLTS